MDDLIKNMGKNIRRYRLERKWSQMELGMLSDIHGTYISQIERGVRPDVSVRVMKKISDVFGITFNELTYQESNVI